MYPAKAAAIRKVALDVWAPGREPTEKSIVAIDRTIHEVYASPDLSVDDLAITLDVPKPLKHREFVLLVRSLADNPLVS